WGAVGFKTKSEWGPCFYETDETQLLARHRRDFGAEVTRKYELAGTTLGFSWYGPPYLMTRARTSTQRSFPLWLPPLFTAALSYFLGRVRQRFPSGHCRSCGYDLRATPDRCPECGTAVASTTRPRAPLQEPA